MYHKRTKRQDTMNLENRRLREIQKEKQMARVLISMPERFLDEIDNLALNENRTRSELIREALRTYMYRNQVRNSKRAEKNAELLEDLLS